MRRCRRRRRRRRRPLDQLHDALRVHEEHLPVRLPLQGGGVAVQNVGDLEEENVS